MQAVMQYENILRISFHFDIYLFPLFFFCFKVSKEFTEKEKFCDKN